MNIQKTGMESQLKEIAKLRENNLAAKIKEAAKKGKEQVESDIKVNKEVNSWQNRADKIKGKKEPGEPIVQNPLKSGNENQVSNAVNVIA